MDNSPIQPLQLAAPAETISAWRNTGYLSRPRRSKAAHEAGPVKLVWQCLDGILPQGCALCGQRITDSRICEPCRRELPWITVACPVCAMPQPSGPAQACGACQQRRSPIAQTIAPLHYRFPVDALIKSLKFRGQLSLAPALVEVTAGAVVERQLDVDVISPVPLHRWRHAWRGFNQATELARALGRHLDLPLANLLRRRRATVPQTGLDAAQRRRNLHKAFSATARPMPAKVLLVDDVVTTGETARSAAVALRSAGVREVSLVAIARAS